MSTARHIYTLLPDEQHKRASRPAQCRVQGCHNFALIDGLCMRCDEEITALESWVCHAILRSKRRAEMRARFWAKFWSCLKVAAGISLYLGFVVGMICMAVKMWRAIW